MLISAHSVLNDANGVAGVVKNIVKHLPREVDKAWLRADGKTFAYEWTENNTREIAHAAQADAQQYEKEINILHDNGIWLRSNHSNALWARARGIRHIVSPHGMLEPWALRHKKWKKRLAWWLYQRKDICNATLIHATSLQEAKHLNLLGIRRPIAVIPNGVDLPEELAANNKRITEERTALYLSRLHPKKGILNLIRAWRQVRPSGWKLVIAGPDDRGHESVIRAMLNETRLPDRIELIGPVFGQRKWKALADADLFILPTHSENFGLVIAEALASGTPVITTRAAPWEELETYECGWWVDVGVEPLAEAIREATRLSRTDRRVMGSRGRALVATKYTWPKIATQMKQAYEWVLGGGPAPDMVLF